MKKLSLALLTVAAIFGFAVNVDARVVTEAESALVAKVEKTYKINGEDVKLKAGAIKVIKDYINDFGVSDADCAVLSTKVDEAIAIAKNGNATSWSGMTASEKNQIKALVSEINNDTAIQVTLNDSGEVVVINPTTGNPYATLNDVIVADEKEDEEDGADVSNTAAYDTSTIILGGISLIGLLLVTKKVVKANA